jgi:hypothetical protein
MALASFKALLLLAGAEHSLWLLLFQLAEKLRAARRMGKSFFVVCAAKIFIRRGRRLVSLLVASANFRERKFS